MHNGFLKSGREPKRRHSAKVIYVEWKIVRGAHLFFVHITRVFWQIILNSFISNASIDAPFSISKLAKKTLFRHKASKSADCPSLFIYRKNT